MSEKSYYIPKHLDDPPKAFWWDMDEIILFACVIFPGILLRNFSLLLVFMTVGAICVLQYTQLKAGRLKGFLWHFAYWQLGFRFKGIPESSIREFSG